MNPSCHGKMVLGWSPPSDSQPCLQSLHPFVVNNVSYRPNARRSMRSELARDAQRTEQDLQDSRSGFSRGSEISNISRSLIWKEEAGHEK